MLFHGALFELALFEIPQGDGSVVEVFLSDTISLSLSDSFAPVVPRIGMSDTISLGVEDDMAGSAQATLEDYITLAMSELSEFTKYMPPRSAIGRVASGGVSGKLKGIRPGGSVGSGRTRGYVG